MKTKNLAELIELEHANPLQVRDYCYYDGCPTNWYRDSITKIRKGAKIKYVCEECATERFYELKLRAKPNDQSA